MLPHRALLLSAVAALLLLPPATPVSFNYTRFGDGVVPSADCPEGIRQLCLQQDAAVVGPDSHLQLTNKVASQGLALYSEPVPLWDGGGRLTNLTTVFRVNFTKLENNCTLFADGLAFLLSAYPHVTPPVSDDGMLGLVNKSDRLNASGSASFLAVEVDTFTNEKWDPPYFHLGIDVNSLRSVELGNLTALAGGTLNVVGEVEVDYSSATGNLTATMRRDGVVYVRLSHHVDLRLVGLSRLAAVGLSATSGYCMEHFNVMSWSFNSTWDYVAGKTTSKRWIGITVAVVGSSLLLAVLIVFAVVALRQRRRIGEGGGGQEDEERKKYDETTAPMDPGGPRRLKYQDLAAATANFDEKRRLGAGGSGEVYRGFLKELNREVAVKRVHKRGAEQRRKEFAAEVRAIGRLRHRHLVQLLGWCESHRRGEYLLAYELMSNRSLDHHLFRPSGRSLPWAQRYSVALGVASALLYLHEENEQCVVHRDVKSSNVLLDDVFTAKLGDFGLARLVDHGCELRTTAAGGTLAYMSPEYFATGRASRESDVYAFGVVALELATGRRALERKEGDAGAVRALVPWVWGLFETDAVAEAGDGRVAGGMDAVERGQLERLLVVGLWCAHPDADCRPAIGKAVAALKFEDVRIDVPRRMPTVTFAAPPDLTASTSAVSPQYYYLSGDTEAAAATSFADISLPSICFDGR